MMSPKLSFASDYLEGAHPAILKRLCESNLEQTTGYGLDPYSKSAVDKIRQACAKSDAMVYFLVGGTQTNATVIDSMLRNGEGVIAADTGHVSLHEAGAIEFTGHKVLTLAHTNGKLAASQVQDYLEGFEADGNRDHMVQPAMLYVSQPTEYGTIYSLSELEALSAVCRQHGIALYLDGARLAYALACEQNDVSLADLARLCDAFYIGGTKCGALFGEAVVVPDPKRIPHFFTLIKQHGALLAKGRLLGLQFDTLFTDNLYFEIGKKAIRLADDIRLALRRAGFTLCFDSPTNQIFVEMENTEMQRLQTKVDFSFWERRDATHTVVRFATSWATTEENVKTLCSLLAEAKKES